MIMRYYKDLEKVFENYDFSPVSSDITMFNSDFNKNNELTIMVGNFIEDSTDFRVYVDGESSYKVSDLSEVYTILRSLGFGKDYSVTWSLYDFEDDSGDYGIINITT